jgi:hypothetical protein
MITTRELSTHIYNKILDIAEKKSQNIEINDSNEIGYIQNLIELHFEPDGHLGSKGFVSISKIDGNKTEYGC